MTMPGARRPGETGPVTPQGGHGAASKPSNMSVPHTKSAHDMAMKSEKAIQG